MSEADRGVAAGPLPSGHPRTRAATAVSERAVATPRDPERQARAERWEDRLAVPVLVAALVSVPAVFLTTLGGLPAVVGRVLNWISLAVLLGESIVPLALSRDVTDWLRAHKWELALVAASVPAVVFAVGPVQVLRVVLSVAALRILRVGRIVRAGRVLARRLRLDARAGKLIVVLAVLLALAYGGIVLANPESRTRRLLAWLVDRLGLAWTILAGIGAVAVLVVGLRRLLRTRLLGTVRAARREHRHRTRRRGRHTQVNADAARSGEQAPAGPPQRRDAPPRPQ